MQSYILSGKNLWFSRGVNGEFNSKWHGLNSSKKHLLDYFSLKHKKDWLELTHSDIELNKSEHYYGKIVENVGIRNNLIINYEGLKKNAMLEVGVNIRENHENLNHKEYKVEKLKKMVKINDLIINSNAKIMKLETFYKTHFPGRERTDFYDLDEKPQECLVLKIFFKKCKNLTINIGHSKKLETKGMNKFLLEKYFINNAFIAGFPYFTNCWVRDFALCVKPLIKLGYESLVKKTIEKIIFLQRDDGSVPTRLDEPDSVSDDSTPIFAAALKQYCKLTGDKSFEKNRRKALKWKGNTSLTWMDSLKRKRAFEIPWFYKAGGKRIKKNKLKIKKHVNSLFLIYFDLLSKKESIKLLKYFEKYYTVKEGITTESFNRKAYNINSYHKGRVWHFLTLLMCLCEYKLGRTSQAEEYFRKAENFFGENCMYHLPETTNSDFCTGFAQFWSDVLFEYAKLFIKKET